MRWRRSEHIGTLQDGLFLGKYPYKRNEWLNYREECLKKADFRCERCGRCGILQVHHPEYLPGRQPWQYPVWSCEVLCRVCHAEEHGKIPPRSGWIILDSGLDRNEPSDPIPCANCDTEIRWHFTIFHPDWGEWVVGSECAENLSLGPEVKLIKSYNRRLRTFIGSPRWKKTPKGWSIRQNGHRVIVYRKNGLYRLKIGQKFGRADYTTEAAAKQKAFEVLEFRKLRHAKNSKNSTSL